ncbi:unnamed protein product [Tenebrio molitor]|nr:unnamed protein product [Tenebrio molitor]
MCQAVNTRELLQLYHLKIKFSITNSPTLDGFVFACLRCRLRWGRK